ncbi:MAG: DUF4118 domain-containing protein [Sterolibacterium sp.]|jgi:two-component system sensor histidine kinase KdpD
MADSIRDIREDEVDARPFTPFLLAQCNNVREVPVEPSILKSMEANQRPADTPSDRSDSDAAAAPSHYLLAALVCSLATMIALPLLAYFDLANIVMIFLLAVVLIALRFGRGPAVMAAFMSVALFDFFFVPPRFSFTVNDGQYLLTFAVMLVVALVIGHLVTGLQQQARHARLSEERTGQLYQLARELGGALTLGQVDDIARRYLWREMRIHSMILVPAENGSLSAVAPESQDGENRCVFKIEQRLARMTFATAEPVEFNALSEASYAAYYFPLKTPTRVRGVIALAPESPDAALVKGNHPLLETLSSLIAIAVERLHYVDVAHAAQLDMASERLRNSVLSALSHDLRTPLTALVGLADSLTLARPALPAPQHETAEALREQALRINGLLENLLDMARLQAGTVKLRKEWQPLEEVVGASIKLLERSLLDRPVKVTIAGDLPLLAFDAVLIERVFCNLIENAAKYAPPGTAIEINARRSGDLAEISVADHGPGVNEIAAAGLFEMFVRGEQESATPGVGLGLAICRAIVESHGGTIVVANRPEGGACFSFSLPLGDPPGIEAEAAVTASAGDIHGR